MRKDIRQCGIKAFQLAQGCHSTPLMLNDVSQALRLAATGAALYLVFKAFRLIHKSWTSPLKNIPGPRNASLIFGNMKEFWRLVCPQRVFRTFSDPPSRMPVRNDGA